jgi:hypothetical protein|tara:strand:- start:1599 stop:1835 length:237 start_codon:yes stop_codon:yes gene_type:complete
MSSGYYVDDLYRRNPKSLVPGGWDLEVKFKTGEIRIYSNIKNTEAYAKHIISKDNNIKSVTVLKESFSNVLKDNNNEQ